jgi:hypothetical protein
MGLFSPKVTDKEIRDYKAGKRVPSRVAREAAVRADRQAKIRERHTQDAKDRKAAAASRAKVAKDNAKSSRSGTGKPSKSWW